MSLWHIAWSYLWNRKLTTVLTILSVALAAGMISAVLTLREETKKRFEEESQAFDLVVGAKGSPLQLVLSSVYFMDTPTGAILYSDYEKLKALPDVTAAFPIGLGDTVKGFRIVGTDKGLLSHRWTNAIGQEKAPFRMAEGRVFEKPMEAVLGSVVARKTGLKVGDSFTGTHGFTEGVAGSGHDHSNQPYTVVGLLAPSGTPMDRAAFCDLRSVWEVHGHHEHGDRHDDEAEEGHDHAAEATAGNERTEEDHLDDAAEEPADSTARGDQVTAILVQLNSPAARFPMRPYINKHFNAMAAVPTDEIQTLYNQLLGAAKTVLLTIGYLVVAISALSILIGLYLSILQRRRDLAIMRALGASAYEIVGAVLIEAFWVTLLGIGSGWILGRGLTFALGQYMTERFGMTINAFSYNAEEIGAFATIALVGLIAGIVPAWQAYRTDIARDLAEN
ncbi:MAG TPA: ABC transporter permease [Candidatus Hydrogenedentes bacterium]|nr:ABC transporter permease [Candidatus Hydrogenedentota bacterium]HOS01656.1 ABC transporter permease [Candidatus Hydrogenedentota bacterium]